MRILFINTLRLGDTLMSWHIIRGLQLKYPGAQIDYLTFDNSKASLPLLQTDVCFHFISRSLIQDMNADIDVSIFRAYDELQKELKPLLAKRYDLAINYSNTKISTYLTSMIEAATTIGSHFNSQKILNYGSRWIEYLDTKSTKTNGGEFHFNEIFSNALGLRVPEDSVLNESNAGIVEVKKYINLNKKKYVLQLFTSDIKKDFPQHKLQSFLIELNKHLDGEFLLLCMPDSAHETLALPIKNARWVPCSLEGAYSLLRTAEGLITVDTSIKHLATFTNAKIVELCFGSSQPHQTGSYKTNSLVVQSREYCYPCKHSSACSREEVYCSQRIQEMDLAALIGQFYNNHSLLNYASFKHSVTYFDGHHYVLQSNYTSQMRECILAKLSWIYHLSDSVSEEVHSLVHFFIEEISDCSFERLDQNIIYLQRELESVFMALKVGESYKDFIEDQRFINLQGVLKNLNLDFHLPNAQEKIDFRQTRFLQNQLQNLLQYLNSYRKLNQDIISEAKYYERANSKNITI